MTIVSTGQKSIYDMNDVYSDVDKPANPTEGSLWFDTVNKKLYVYSNNDWIFAMDGVDIGGRNLLKNTSKFKDTTYWSLSLGTGVSGTLSVVSDTTYGNVIQATKTTDGGSWWVFGISNSGLTLANKKFVTGKEYTLSFMVKNAIPITVNFMDGNGTNSVITSSKAIAINPSWTKFEWTFKADGTGNIPQLYISKSGTALGSVLITNVQLEEGNIPTGYTSAPEDVETVITDIWETLGNMASDNILDCNERQVIKDKLTDILGYVIKSDVTALPTGATLETGGIGDYYIVRSSANLAGISTNDTLYKAVETQYTALKSYLDAVTPVKPWDTSTVNKDLVIDVSDKDIFRKKWVDYYNAVNDLYESTTQKLKQNVDDVTVGGRNFSQNSNFAYYTTNTTVGWDNTKNGTNVLTGWTGYNGSVLSPSTGYHAHVNTTKFSYPVLELIDRNSTFGGLHRWLASSQTLPSTSSFASSLVVSKTYTLSMEVYSDTIGSVINTGMYHYKKSTGVLSFHSFQWDLPPSTKTNTWEKKTITFTIDPDWDLTKDNSIYIYGNYSTMECSQWVKNIMLEEGNKASAWSPSIEDINKYASDQSQAGKDAWSKFSGANNTLPSGTVTWGNNVTTTSVENAVLNFNTRNDRITTIPANPSINTDGSAIDHTVNTDGSCDISFEWNFTATGDSGDIDGFIVYVFAGASANAYSFGTSSASEQVFYTTPDKRALIIYGIPANRYYTFGVQAYRIVDKDISATGVLKSSIIKSSATGENPYLPSQTVSFDGDITGTINGTDATTVVNQAGNSLQLGKDYNKVTFDANTGMLIRKYDSTAKIDKARVMLNATDGLKIQTSTNGVDFSDTLYIDTSGNAIFTGKVSIGAGTTFASGYNPTSKATIDDIIKATKPKFRYIRDWLSGSSVNAGNHWIEIKASTGLINRASGKVITASSTIAGTNTQVTDGIITAGNTDYVSVAGTSAWVQIDLGAIYSDIEFIQVWHYHADGRTYNGTKTEVSEDGTTWITLYDSAVSGTYKELPTGKLIPVDISKTLGRTGTFIGTDGIYTGILDASQVKTGTLSAIHITSSTMDLAGGKFVIDGLGNATFKGALSGATGTFSGALSGATGTFSGSITTDKNITVGNYILMGDQASATTKGIKFDLNSSILADLWGANFLKITIKAPSVEIASNSDGSGSIICEGKDVWIQPNIGGYAYFTADLNVGYNKLIGVANITMADSSTISTESGYINIKSSANGIVYAQGLDLRVTAPNQPSVYRPVRCGIVYANGGIQATVIDMDSFDSNAFTNMYLRPRGELRVCAPTSTTDYNPIRVSGTITGYTHFYTQVASTGEFRVVKNSESTWNSAPSYAPVRASSFPTGSSVKWKTNIERLEVDEALYMLKTTPVYTYHLQTNVDSGIYDKPKVGMLAEAVPQRLRDEDGVDPYSITATLWKVVQEQQSQIESLQQSLSDLEMMLGVDVTPNN
jgi:hypothetical protein